MSLEYSDDEIKRWLWLRAVEWTNFPAFLSQPVAPVLFIFFPWYLVACGVFALGLLWSLVRYRFVSPSIAKNACTVVALLKWPAMILSTIFLFIHHKPIAAVVALIWPFAAAFVGVPGKVGIVELAFAKRLGFVPPDVPVDRSA